MRVCYFGTYRKEYNRNKIMIASMRAVGIEAPNATKIVGEH